MISTHIKPVDLRIAELLICLLLRNLARYQEASNGQDKSHLRNALETHMTELNSQITFKIFNMNAVEYGVGAQTALSKFLVTPDNLSLKKVEQYLRQICEVLNLKELLQIFEGLNTP